MSAPHSRGHIPKSLVEASSKRFEAIDQLHVAGLVNFFSTALYPAKYRKFPPNPASAI